MNCFCRLFEILIILSIVRVKYKNKDLRIIPERCKKNTKKYNLKSKHKNDK